MALRQIQRQPPARKLLGFALEELKPLCTIKHTITRYRITVDAFRIQVGQIFRSAPSSRPARPPRDEEHWLPLAELHKLSFPARTKDFEDAFRSQFMKIRDILRQATQKQPPAWLFLPDNYWEWTLDTEAILVDYLKPFLSTRKPRIRLFHRNWFPKFRETIDTQPIADCVGWADRLSGRDDDAVRFESLVYYIRFDAFLPRIGAPEPPPAEEIMRNADLEFTKTRARRFGTPLRTRRVRPWCYSQ